jgi:hypothetical protein
MEFKEEYCQTYLEFNAEYCSAGKEFEVYYMAQHIWNSN